MTPIQANSHDIHYKAALLTAADLLTEFHHICANCGHLETLAETLRRHALLSPYTTARIVQEQSPLFIQVEPKPAMVPFEHSRS